MNYSDKYFHLFITVSVSTFLTVKKKYVVLKTVLESTKTKMPGYIIHAILQDLMCFCLFIYLLISAFRVTDMDTKSSNSELVCYIPFGKAWIFPPTKS